MEPGCVNIDFTVYVHMIVAGHSFPAASGMRATGAQIAVVDGIGREVIISFRNVAEFAVGEHCAFE
jgi:hypothetical protein